jgi:acetyltransferase-like isoleucine patch superfamily enzyme
MRQNVSQAGIPGENGRFFIQNDWFNHGIPANVVREANVYIETSYSFSAFHSEQACGLHLGEGSGSYDIGCFITGKDAQITVGKFTILNAPTLVCYKEITIGSHCMLAWGSVVTDTWLPSSDSILHRRAILEAAAADPNRMLPAFAEPQPVVLEDNCWIGFGAIVLPGVRVGRGAVVGSKTIIAEDVPAYAVVVGNPAKIVRYLDPDDTEEAKVQAFTEYLVK